ncbi:MAG: S1/P1 nuclease [Bdellovibrionota bacterium]
MKHLLKFLICSLISFTSLFAFAWGSLAHKASAKIAWNFLNDDTKKQVTEILNGGSISEASVWPDSVRRAPEWKYTTWYHFEKAPDNTTYLENLRQQDDRTRLLGGLLEALYIAEDTFKNHASTKVEREHALKFAVHFIGDIHQPLHTGRVEDKGGNKIPIKWLGLDTNLHSVWDSQMIYLAYKNQLGVMDADQSQIYADILLTKFKDYKPTPELFTRYDDWMHESMIPRSDAYAFKDENEEAYTSRFIDIVDKRVYLAGLRIALMTQRLVALVRPLEDVADPLQTLRKAIVDIVGDFTAFVSLKPRLALGGPPPVTNPVP